MTTIRTGACSPTILTYDAVQTLADIHHRTPLILPEARWLHWLDPSIGGDQTLVGYAVRAGAAEAETLRFDQVDQFKPLTEGRTLSSPSHDAPTAQGSAGATGDSTG